MPPWCCGPGPKVIGGHGLRLDPTGTAHATDVLGAGDLVIAACDNAHEDLAGGPVRPRLRWSVPDPVRVDTDTMGCGDACPSSPANATKRQPPPTQGKNSPA
jgi:hypothetical protein